MEGSGHGDDATANERMQEGAAAATPTVETPPVMTAAGANSVVQDAQVPASTATNGAGVLEKSSPDRVEPPTNAAARAAEGPSGGSTQQETAAKDQQDDDKELSKAVDEDGDAVMKDGAREKSSPKTQRKKVEDFHNTLVDHFKQAMVDEASDDQGQALVAELFEFLYEGVRKHGLVPKTASELPSTTPVQQQQLLTLLRTLIAEKQSSLQRVETALSELINAVFRSKWTLDQLLRDRVARAQVPEAPPSTAWGRPDQKLAVKPVDACLSADMAPFRFDTTVYNPADVTRLKALCHAAHGFAEKPRKPTEDEWTIIWGLMNGTILMRSLPQFLKRCCTMKQFQWLHHYMVVAVEGELYATLPSQSPMFDVNQTSKRLADDIRAYVVHNDWEERERVFAMLKAVKVVSYNKERHALHFHFFTKKAAIEWENMTIPFRNSKIQLKNPDARYREVTINEDGSKQITFRPPADGVRDDRYQVPYKFRLTNITRTTEIDKIAQYLQQLTGNGLRIGVPIDTYGQGSEWSLVWEFFGTKASCPPALAPINRILWRDHAILVLHKAGSSNAPCYRCARLGHHAATCTTPEADWINETTLVVTDPEIAALETERAIWQSAEDAKAIFERLGLESPNAQTPVQPPPTSAPTAQQGDKAADAAPAPQKEVEQKPAHLQTPREHATSEWLTAMSKRGRGQKPTQATSATKSTPGGGKATPKQRQRGNSRRKNGGSNKTDVVDLAGDSDTEAPRPTDNDHQNAEDGADKEESTAAKGPAPQRSQPAAQDKQQAENEFLNNERARSNMERIGLTMTSLALRHRKQLDATALLATLLTKLPDLGDKASTAWLLEALSAQLTKTPMTGNCQFFAIPEALLQLGLRGLLDDSVVLELTMLLKYGMYLAHKVDHESELGISYIAALQDKVAAEPAAIRKYFEDLAASSSERTTILQEELWGGHDTLRMAAKLLDRRIDLIIETDDASEVNVMQFQPQRVRDQRTKALFESAAMVQPGIQVWLETIRDDLARGKIPIILHFSPKAEHYNAVLLHRDPTPTSAKRQTDLRDHLNPVQTIDEHINQAKKNGAKKPLTNGADDQGPTRKMLIESQSDIEPQTALSVLTQTNWTREEKKIVIDCLIHDPPSLKALLTFCGPDSQESEVSLQCAQDKPDSSASAKTSDSSFHPSSGSEADSSDDEEAAYAFPSPQQGRAYTTWVKRKWKEVQDEWAEQDAGKLPQLDDLDALHDYAVKHPDELAAAGQLFANPFRFLDHFENEGLKNWMRPRWLQSCMKALLNRVDGIPDPAVREEVRDALKFIDDSPTLAVRLRKWQQRKFWRQLKTALPTCFKGDQAIPFLADTMPLTAACVFAMDALLPLLARDLQSLADDQDMEPKTLAQLYLHLPAFRAALDASVENNAWDHVETYLHSLKFPDTVSGPAQRC